MLKVFKAPLRLICKVSLPIRDSSLCLIKMHLVTLNAGSCRITLRTYYYFLRFCAMLTAKQKLRVMRIRPLHITPGFPSSMSCCVILNGSY